MSVWESIQAGWMTWMTVSMFALMSAVDRANGKSRR